VRLVNFPEDIRPEDFTALALSSDTRDTLQFECNDPRLNRLWQNTVWSQKANTIAIPTDCPQREKAGWTGDMQVFSATIVQNTDSNAFLSSWLYEVKSGATSIWECWDAKLPSGKVQTVSYNHYAYGCVDDWIYRHIVGLTAIEPAYRKFRVEPHPQCGLTHVKESFRSPYGDIVVEWKNEDTFSLQVEVPVGTEAEIVLPNGQTHTVGSGTYSF